MTFSPLRVDFVGGWLDVPKNAVAGGYIINCTIQPCVTLKNWCYKTNSGLGGSAAYAILSGFNPYCKDPGWQDPAVILETGLCVWESGQKPILSAKYNPEFLRGHMSLHWTGHEHFTNALAVINRNYFNIADISNEAAVKLFTRLDYLSVLIDAVDKSYQLQLEEGMDPLPEVPGAVRKYCGSGHGGYALYLFRDKNTRNTFVKDHSGVLAVEPYMRLQDGY